MHRSLKLEHRATDLYVASSNSFRSEIIWQFTHFSLKNVQTQEAIYERYESEFLELMFRLKKMIVYLKSYFKFVLDQISNNT